MGYGKGLVQLVGLQRDTSSHVNVVPVSSGVGRDG